MFSSISTIKKGSIQYEVLEYLRKTKKNTIN